MYELNPDHTHFILVEEDGKDGQSGSMRCAIEKQLQTKQGRQKLIRLMSVGNVLGKQFGPRSGPKIDQARQIFGPDLDPNCLTL